MDKQECPECSLRVSHMATYCPRCKEKLGPNPGEFLCGTWERPISKENLPLPFVHYPSIYGVYLAFGESLDSVPKLCECSRKSFNQATAKFISKSEVYSNKVRALLPRALTDFYLSEEDDRGPGSVVPMETIKVIFKETEFSEGLCHVCNPDVIPAFHYALGGNSFKNNYGWYIEQVRLEHGLSPYTETSPLWKQSIRDIEQDVQDPDLIQLVKEYIVAIKEQENMKGVAPKMEDFDTFQEWYESNSSVAQSNRDNLSLQSQFKLVRKSFAAMDNYVENVTLCKKK